MVLQMAVGQNKELEYGKDRQDNDIAMSKAAGQEAVDQFGK